MRRLALALLVVAAGVAAVAVTVAGGDGARDDGAYRVRAVFANAFALVPGLDVKSAGVPVGEVERLEVTEHGHAAVVLRIDAPAARPFRADATCRIRPQSLIGERYVECTPTQARAEGGTVARALPAVPAGRPGAGEHLLSLARTTKPVDPDLLTNTMRLPERERLRIVLDELGTGLAARGDDLRDALHRADPALAATDRVADVLAGQTRALERLARDADAALAPASRDRRDVAAFVRHAARTATVGARRRSELEAATAKLPGLLRELPATLATAGALARRATPVVRDLHAAAPGATAAVRGLPALLREGAPALRRAGAAADVVRPVLPRVVPVLRELRTLGRTVQPVAGDLRALARSLDDTGAIGRLVDFAFFSVMSANGYDEAGHYLRAGLQVNACSTYVTESTPDCIATFAGRGKAPSTTATPARATAATAADDRLLDLLLGDG
ncbi:MlaD family protein [Conexibacter sp. SYSU D00693]|uniref:MlaD family protein n=1 Tax=Conexibacter sp. SYSU D00693 TaxID=2812560 RepID=UPI00196B10C9|nr:MCE family protein [Conexibacter sp. SYSU D00693]